MRYLIDVDPQDCIDNPKFKIMENTLLIKH